MSKARRAAGPNSAPYRDPRLAVDNRVRDLLARMSVEEKLAQLGGVWASTLIEGGKLSVERAKEALASGIGHVSRIAGSTVLGPAESARVANAIQKLLVEETRLGIPAIVHEESCAGYLARGATCFPQAIGLASTWEPDLVEEMAKVIRRQMRAVGAHQSLAPVLDVARDPRWGRTEETFGEDPYLIARTGAAYVRGLQGTDLSRGVAATGKHFIGYGASQGGMNWAPAHIPTRELLDTYLVPFRAAITEAGLAAVMNAYNEIDGVPLAASRELMVDLLRGRLGFAGVVVSDYFAIASLADYHRTAANEGEAARLALEAGLDVELPATHCYGAPLGAALDAGRVSIDLVDAAVARVLAMKFRLGLFENPYVDAEAAPQSFDTSEQRALALRIAEKSIVLLKNEGDILPLDPNLRALAVIGPSAASRRLLQGDYHYPTHLEVLFGAIDEGSEKPPPSGVDLGRCFVPTVTILDGIRALVAPATRVEYAPGAEITGDSREGFAAAFDAARRADVAVVVVGDRSGLADGCTSGESNDRADLGLPGVQQALVEAVHASGTPLVVVLVNGRPLALCWIAAHVPAIVEAWLPGEEGGNAVAAVLFGRANPAGRLPISFPARVGQVPVYYNHKPSGGRSHWKGSYADSSAEPLFPFGHGLSFTRFEYSNLSVTPAEIGPHGSVRIEAEIENVGARAGEEVVQLYVHDVLGSVTRPLRELRGFTRLALAAGERKTVTFVLAASELAFHDRDMELVVEPGTIEVMLGASSREIRLTGRFEISGETVRIPDSF